jgi:AbrB family looped-hinge helix DNA binding protein
MQRYKAHKNKGLDAKSTDFVKIKRYFNLSEFLWRVLYYKIRVILMGIDQMRITSKGQVTIPKSIRDQAGFLPHTDVEFIYDRKDVRVVATKSPTKESRGETVIRLLKGSATVAMSTDDIMALTRGE